MNDPILKRKQRASTTSNVVLLWDIWLNSTQQFLRNCRPHSTVTSTVMAYSRQFSICYQRALNDPILKIKQHASTTTSTVLLCHILIEFHLTVCEELLSTSNIVISNVMAYSCQFSICHQGALNDPILKTKPCASTTITTLFLWHIWLNSTQRFLRNCCPHTTVKATVMVYSRQFAICHQMALNNPILKIKQCASTTTNIVLLWHIWLNSTKQFLRNCCPHPT